MSGNVIDLSAHMDGNFIEASRRQWDAALEAVSGKHPLYSIASRILTDIDQVRLKALKGRNVGLIQPAVQVEGPHAVVIALAINAMNADARPYQTLRFTYEQVREEQPRKLALHEIKSLLDDLSLDTYVYKQTSAVVALCHFPIIAFRHHFDGRVTGATRRATGWTATLFARYPTPGKCVQMVVEYESDRLHDLDRVMSERDPSRR